MSAKSYEAYKLDSNNDSYSQQQLLMVVHLKLRPKTIRQAKSTDIDA